MIKETIIKNNNVSMVLIPESEIENELFIRFNSRESNYVKLSKTDKSYYDNRIQLNFKIK